MDEFEYMLTTVDNPYDPFTHWPEWYAFDVSHGYHCPSVVAMFARTSPALSDADNCLAINNAIDEIIKYDARGIFKKVGHKRVDRYVQ